jgi:hypothetical protein
MLRDRGAMRPGGAGPSAAVVARRPAAGPSLPHPAAGLALLRHQRPAALYRPPVLVLRLVSSSRLVLSRHCVCNHTGTICGLPAAPPSRVRYPVPPQAHRGPRPLLLQLHALRCPEDLVRRLGRPARQVRARGACAPTHCPPARTSTPLIYECLPRQLRPPRGLREGGGAGDRETGLGVLWAVGVPCHAQRLSERGETAGCARAPSLRAHARSPAGAVARWRGAGGAAGAGGLCGGTQAPPRERGAEGDRGACFRGLPSGALHGAQAARGRRYTRRRRRRRRGRRRTRLLLLPLPPLLLLLVALLLVPSGPTLTGARDLMRFVHGL